MSEPIADHYVGFRVFGARGHELTSHAVDYVYEPGVNIAACHSDKTHEPPVRRCGCGFWLYHTEWRARAQFGETTVMAYGDFGDEPTHKVLGKVLGGGRAIVGDDGARVAECRIVALITDTPAPFSGVLDHYGIEALDPVSITTAWIVNVVDDSMVVLDRPNRDTDEATGRFMVDEGLAVPQPGTYVIAEYEMRDAIRFITRFGRPEGDFETAAP